MERLVAGSRWRDTGHVFATTVGTPIEAARVTRSFALALERAGLAHIRFHDLRHAAATFLLAQGFTLEDVKNLLGHSSIVLTSDTYGHLLEQRQLEVARGMDAALGGWVIMAAVPDAVPDGQTIREWTATPRQSRTP